MRNDTPKLDLGLRVTRLPHIVLASRVHTYAGQEGHSDYYTVHWLTLVLVILSFLGLGRLARDLASKAA
jgi:hypothetical protein